MSFPDNQRRKLIPRKKGVGISKKVNAVLFVRWKTDGNVTPVTKSEQDAEIPNSALEADHSDESRRSGPIAACDKAWRVFGKRNEHPDQKYIAEKDKIIPPLV